LAGKQWGSSNQANRKLAAISPKEFLAYLSDMVKWELISQKVALFRLTTEFRSVQKFGNIE